jgi:hypothetical protein
MCSSSHQKPGAVAAAARHTQQKRHERERERERKCAKCCFVWRRIVTAGVWALAAGAATFLFVIVCAAVDTWVGDFVAGEKAFYAHVARTLLSECSNATLLAASTDIRGACARSREIRAAGVVNAIVGEMQRFTNNDIMDIIDKRSEDLVSLTLSQAVGCAVLAVFVWYIIRDANRRATAKQAKRADEGDGDGDALAPSLAAPAVVAARSPHASVAVDRRQVYYFSGRASKQQPPSQTSSVTASATAMAAPAPASGAAAAAAVASGT